MFEVDVYKFPMDSPYDLSKIEQNIEENTIDPKNIVAMIAKTEGNGRVNDYTRYLCTRAFVDLICEKTGWGKDKIKDKIITVGSGGCEGVMSPHITVFTKQEISEEETSATSKEKKLTIGTAYTRNFEPEEIGTLNQVKEVAKAVKKAMNDAKIDKLEDVHYVQVKSPLLDMHAINAARKNNRELKTYDTVKSMGYSNGSSGLGIALGLEEVDAGELKEEDICRREDLYTSRGGSSAGIEMKNCEVFVLGNSVKSISNFTIGHDTLKDFLDVEATKNALRDAGLEFDCCISEKQKKQIVQMFAKGQVDIYGQLRGRRTTLLTDSDLGTRPARAVVNAMISSVVGDPAIYVSAGWGYHQGPVGGGVVAAIIKS